MENKGQGKKEGQDQKEKSQELYVEKADEHATGKNAIDIAGAFGSSASKTEHVAQPSDPDRRQSEDGSDQDGQARDTD